MASGLPEEDEPTIAETEGPDLVSTPAATAHDLTGQRFGACRIIRAIGRGGMGMGYLAERADDQFRKRVALKTLRREFTDVEVLYRFYQERQILAARSHPNIARLMDGGTLPQKLQNLQEAVASHQRAGAIDAAELSGDPNKATLETMHRSPRRTLAICASAACRI